MSIDEKAFEATFARMTRNISDETSPAGYKWAMQFIKHYEGAKPIGKTLIADDKDNVWRDDSGDIWEPIRARALAQEFVLVDDPLCQRCWNPKEMGWQPIETAPKDGTHILGFLPYNGGFVMETWWHIDSRGGVWFHEDGEVCPTYWMPKPSTNEIEGAAKVTNRK